MELIKQNRSIALVIGAVIVTVVIAAVALVFTSPASTADVYARYASIENTRLNDGGFVLGDPEAPITIVEFGDFACPHCQQYSLETKRFIDEYVATGKAKFEYRMFISGADPAYGPRTAQLAECAAEQQEGAFWPAHDILFEMGRNQGRFNERTSRTLADRLELDYAELLNCADDARQFELDVRLGQSLNVQSTPTMMVRYGDGDLQYINWQAQDFSRGGVPYQVLQAVVESAQ
jgi:protein-disulfide isomerase